MQRRQPSMICSIDSSSRLAGHENIIKKQNVVVRNGATWRTFCKSQGKFFSSFLCTLFLHIFDT